MAGEQHIVYVPGGRFVSGDLMKKRTTNARGQAIPEDKQQFEVGIAFRKDAPDAQNFWAQLIGAAKAVCPPNCHQSIDMWLQNGFQGFSMKVGDGDKPSARTQQVNDNTAGHWVIYLSSSFPFNCYNDQNIQIDPASIERGYYVDATVSIGYNGQSPGDGAGIYVNPGMFRLLGIGEVIRGGLNEQEHIGHMPTAPTLPPGATPPGIAPPAPAMPGAPVQPGAAPMQPGMPQQQPPMTPPQGTPGMAPAAAPMQPGMPAQQPGMAPQQPGMPQQQPGMAPQQPGMPQQPAPTAQPPGAPVTPGVAPAGGMPPGMPQQPTATGAPTNPPYPGIMQPGTGT